MGLILRRCKDMKMGRGHTGAGAMKRREEDCEIRLTASWTYKCMSSSTTAYGLWGIPYRMGNSRERALNPESILL
jgi:hypothetical protein